ncbi:hypothetical protein DEO72_LG3g1348 [Vigna unguiculata]|uniref:Uncharacterized protein n=1 Tax=Vigna unguiculata TaxID=3917 RepID=A0A4D6LDY4_VIGUN|nr:hypothetical protein DEO72_LG3g1348 [Vigna unguiculata]
MDEASEDLRMNRTRGVFGDGYCRRKYEQKDILGAKFPMSRHKKCKKKDKLSNKSTEQDLDVFLLEEGNKDDEPGTPYYFKDVSLNAFIFKAIC